MKTLHAKSPCCKAKVYRLNNKRRQCSSCKKTWSIRPKKRGRKSIRVHPSLELTVIERRESLRHKAQRLNKGRELLRRRHERNLDSLLRRLPRPTAPRGPLIAVIDGWGIRLNKQRYTLYQILLRSVNNKYAIPMEPVVLSGWEKIDGWNYTFKTLPLSAQKRIKAMVSDGITGIEALARDKGWIIQRCHFHLLAKLQSLRGSRWSTVSSKSLREKIYQNVVQIVQIPNKRKAERLLQETRQLIRRPDCPKWINLKVSGFIRKSYAFRAYLDHPELNLPNTTNSAECVFDKVTETVRLTKGFSSAKSFEKWIKVQIRNMKPVQCNGKNSNDFLQK